MAIIMHKILKKWVSSLKSDDAANNISQTLLPSFIGQPIRGTFLYTDITCCFTIILSQTVKDLNEDPDAE